MKQLFRTKIDAMLFMIFTVTIAFTLKIERKDSSIWLPGVHLTDAQFDLLTVTMRSEAPNDFHSILRKHTNAHGITGTKILLTNALHRQLVVKCDPSSIHHHSSRIFDRLTRAHQMMATLQPSM